MCVLGGLRRQGRRVGLRFRCSTSRSYSFGDHRTYHCLDAGFDCWRKLGPSADHLPKGVVAAHGSAGLSAGVAHLPFASSFAIGGCAPGSQLPKLALLQTSYAHSS